MRDRNWNSGEETTTRPDRTAHSTTKRRKRMPQPGRDPPPKRPRCLRYSVELRQAGNCRAIGANGPRKAKSSAFLWHSSAGRVTDERLQVEAGLLPGITVRELVFGLSYSRIVNAAFSHAGAKNSFNPSCHGNPYSFSLLLSFPSRASAEPQGCGVDRLR